ncbi:PAS domain S-box protein [Spirosoma pollinicola]|uniref:histidine kinase n=1 Tax=Spirosoma pollinicola TaxID=2057025 RepID=A0A2K8Z7A6_9BACT|nr:PAS domain S-box protein [Spirosoma pollinicola]AUD05728.1 histidine kinase [Spirosoma pollinicola]
MNKLLQSWFDASLQGVAFLTPVRNSQRKVTCFKYRMVNAAFARIIRKPKEELINQVVKKVFDPTQDNDFFLILVSVLESGHEKRLLKHYHIEGEDIWHDITLSRIDDQLMVNVQDVSEHEKTEKELERRFSMESIISSLSSRLVNVSDFEMDAYIPEALEEISEHIGAERASVVLYSNDYQRGDCVHEWCAADIGSKKHTLQDIVISRNDWLLQQLKNRQTLRLQTDKLPVEAGHEKNRLTWLGVQSMIFVPLILSGKTQGFIGFYTISKPKAWDQNDVSLLETFATMIASVFQRLQQETAIRRANQRLEGLHDIDQALLNYRMAGQSPLLIAMKYLYFMVPCERMIVFQLDKSAGLAVVKCRADEGKLDATPGFSVPVSYIQNQFVTGNQTSYHPDLQPESLSEGAERLAYEQGFRSLVIIHLYDRSECIGALALASKTPFFFSDEYRDIARELAGSFAIILHEQRLDEQLKQYTEQLEQRVEERTQEVRRLSTLHQAILKHAGQAIISTDINGIIQTANQACESLMGYPVDELIGRSVHLEPETAENLIPIIAYRDSTDLPEPSTVFAQAIAAHGYFFNECLFVTKDNQKVPILLTASILQDESGAAIGFVGIATDISALKATKAKLVQKNQELNTVFEGAIDLHCIVNADGCFLTVNHAWEITLGYRVDELVELTFEKLIHPDELTLIHQRILSEIDKKPLRNQVNQFQKKDGSYCILEWNAVKIDHLIYASARNITERRQAEVQLRNLNQRLQLATQAAGQGVWELDLEANQSDWDEKMWEIYGLEPQESSPPFAEFLELIHPDDLPGFLERYTLDSSGDSIQNVARFIRPDGAIRYIKAVGQTVRNAQGNAIRQVGVAWDITEQKLAEKALRDSEQKFREIAENVDEVFWIHSAEPFQLLYINPAFERIWGTSLSQLDENPFAFMNVILKEDQLAVWELINQYKAGQEGQLYFRTQESDGPLRWLFVRTFIIRDAADKVIRHIGIISDVTSQKEKEIVLQQTLQREQELNQLKSQFVSTASHEFRTPLATIQTSVDLIKLYLDLPAPSSGPSIQKHLTVIEKQIHQFGILLTDILTIGTIESGKVSFNPQWVDIFSICNEIIATHFSQPVNQRGVRLIREGAPCLVFLDAKLISHVIVNLLSNAFKFSTKAPCLRIAFEETCFVIQIIDEGIGIPARELATLFQAFFRASNTTAIPGTGLGLVIARQFVELHGGHLTLQSEEKKGTTCTVTMPISCAEEAYPVQTKDTISSQHIVHSNEL